MRFESTASRVRSSGACHSISSSKVRLASSIIAHSSPSSVDVDAPLLVAQLAQAERVGQPPRGVDREHGDLLPARRHAERDRRRGRGLAHAARARADADLLALEPVLDHSSSSSRSDSSSSSRRLQLGLEQVRQRRDRRAQPPRAGARAARAAPPPAGARPAPTRSRPARPAIRARRRSRSRCASAALEALGQHAVDHDPARPPCSRSVGEPALEVDRLVDGHLLGQRHADDAGGRPVAQEAVDLGRLARDRADPRDVGVGARGAQQRQRVAGGGRVHDRPCRTTEPPVRRSSLGEVPDLADRDQLGHARAPPR